MAITSADILTAAEFPYRTDVAAGLSGPVLGANKLWLSIWSGETIHAYDEYNMFESLVDSKTISSGVAMEFPITGTVALNASWNAGVELLGSTTDSASATIAIKLDKRPIAAHFEIDNVDLMQTQWEFRSELARQAGMTLSNARDKQISAYIARAGAEDLNFLTTWDGNAQPNPVGTIDPRALPAGPVYLSGKFFDLGRSASANADRANAALDALKACEDFMVYLQTINAPTDGVYLAVEPRAFQDIRALGVARQHSETINMQPMFAGVAAAGGLGAQLTQGMNNLTDSLEYMGVRIIKSNHLPVANISTGIGESRYNLNFGNAGICGLLFQKNAVAALKLQGLKVDTVDDIRRNTTFTVASMMAGTGVLRPECAAVLVKPTVANCVASTTATTEAAFAAATTAAPTDANFFAYGASQTAVNNLAVVNSYLTGAGSGGVDAAKARHGLRCNFGSNFTREVISSAVIGNGVVGFPYNQ
jgi:hypothetical protein